MHTCMRGMRVCGGMQLWIRWGRTGIHVCVYTHTHTRTHIHIHTPHGCDDRRVAGVQQECVSNAGWLHVRGGRPWLKGCVNATATRPRAIREMKQWNNGARRGHRWIATLKRKTQGISVYESMKQIKEMDQRNEMSQWNKTNEQKTHGTNQWN